ncbi:MAG: PQQ-binding-like beta-propeller repeat protein [Acidobacteria bacterium]|nr:PQQ-binding-like beta-propeller repeat protein [Acidobacteriota bacterium]MCI0721477.1 PQQ-binding-like beta-propeller repeat protein [Acidobacteriota bacterium]
MQIATLTYRVLVLSLLASLPGRVIFAGDWPEWRGPARDGTSQETGLPVKWTPAGENLVWKQPYGGRSAPIVMDGRVFLFNSAGEGETMQERAMSLDANTGKLLWERRLNVYESDVPPRRIAWSSPAGDPATGNIYVFGACNELTALSNDGKVLWSRSLTEEFGAWTTHGGRTVSPIIEGDLVIVSTVTDGWGDLAQRRHRYYAFDKKTGESVWISTPGGRPYDTTYSTPITTTIDGMRVMIAGAGDGAVNALKVTTGEPVWSYAVSKRGVNPGVVLKGTTAIVSHQEENLDTSEMGLLAAVNAAAKGSIGKEQIQWAIRNLQLGPASPVIDGDRIYHVDAGSNLFAFDVNMGKELWKQNLGTIQKASLVLADGKLYVGTENGKFFILKPGPAGCEILDEDELESVDKVQIKTEAGDDLIASNEQIIASVAVSRGRIYLVSTKAIYCIGKRSPSRALPLAKVALENAPAGAAVAHVQVVPFDLVIKPGETAKFRVRLLDERGRFIREEQDPTWSLEGLKGEMRQQQFTPAAGAQAGIVKAAVGQVTGSARVRVIPAVPIEEDFSSVAVAAAPGYWINTAGKYAVRQVDGNPVLVKSPNPPAFKRTRSFFGPVSGSDYTVQADVRAVEKRRQMGDTGVVAQRYELVLLGNIQRLELRSWQIEEKRTAKRPFAWKPDIWYRLKLRVENLADGKVSARGKVWAAAEPEPAEWTIEHIDPIGNRQGSPGIFADAPNEVFFDNLKVMSN